VSLCDGTASPRRRAILLGNTQLVQDESQGRFAYELVTLLTHSLGLRQAVSYHGQVAGGERKLEVVILVIACHLVIAERADRQFAESSND
jgi:hypothetical protein